MNTPDEGNHKFSVIGNMQQVIFLVIALLALTHGAWAMKPKPKPPVTYTVLVGYEDVSGVSIAQYFPNTLDIHVGNKVVFVQKTHDPHTVTFYPPGHALPDLFKDGGFFVDTSVALTTYFKGPYNGSFLLSSGVMALGSSLTKFKVTFGEIGTYKFLCGVHGISHNGTINVVDKTTKVMSPMAVDLSVAKTLKMIKKDLVQVNVRALNSSNPPVDLPGGHKNYFVRMGYFEPPYYTYLRFFPPLTYVNPGDKVTFFGGVFHSVTFPNGVAVPTLIGFVNGQPALNPAIYTPTGGSVITRDHFINAGLFVDPTITATLTVGNITGSIEFVCIPHYDSKMIASLFVGPVPTKAPHHKTG